MSSLHKTLAIIALLFLVTNTARVGYVRWIDSRPSELDIVNSTLTLGKVDPKLKSQLESATSLNELVALYKPVYNQAEAMRKAERKDVGLEASENVLEGAIHEWESDSKELRELRFYWFLGFGVFAIGIVVYKLMNRWFGTALLTVAFFEFIYWTTATTSSRYSWARMVSFNRLLTNEFLYSFISLLLLLLTIFVLQIFDQQPPHGRRIEPVLKPTDPSHDH
jgi:hypothetical protein